MKQLKLNFCEPELVAQWHSRLSMKTTGMGTIVGLVSAGLPLRSLPSC